MGLIGAGGIAASHIAGFDALRERARVVAVADTEPRRAMRRAAECGAEQVVTDYRDLLRDPEIDAVDIVTPAATHTPIALEALAAGKHVLCEKPVAGTLAELDRLEAGVAAGGRVFSGVFQYRCGAGAA
ncbi:MAG: Gfo/Idh/MocA family oxidoreductase, partial [Dehalococcoidia bacterium]